MRHQGHGHDSEGYCLAPGEKAEDSASGAEALSAEFERGFKAGQRSARSGDALRKYGRHLSDCAHIQPAVESWRSVSCTCSPEQWWGDHEAGCPRAAAFREWAKSYKAPDCTCGFDAALAASPAEGTSPTSGDALREALLSTIDDIAQHLDQLRDFASFLPLPEGLDVERLRLALRVIPMEDVAEAYSEEVAAEYARLHQPVNREDEPPENWGPGPLGNIDADGKVTL